ncbi:DAPG hydrolase family protein [Streptosporangium sp. V21-05]|uniref:DAPG hydrolase family protein n=1 Tax=Streptosporangium sp. V21-05 TaxID=3446115 RepID=UPI003F53B159
MIQYTPTAADRARFPDSYAVETRYLGYRRSEEAAPYAKYFRADTLPVQEHVREALLGGMAPTEYAYGIQDAARIMSRPGHHKMETGWTRVPGGYLIAVLTDMPGVTAEMWDWWFGWHSAESARYKLWYPDAHQFSALGEDRSADRTLTDRQRYIDNVSYVDEYVGGTLQRLAIRFTDPTRLGFNEPGPGHAVICARVGLSRYPVAQGWLVHQVRPTSHGSEMRSRFFLDDAGMLDLPAHSVPGRGGSLLTARMTRRLGDSALPRVAARALGPTFGYDLAFHCASEMNHLASFLPALHEEFKDTP